jgi:hypothetical protein
MALGIEHVRGAKAVTLTRMLMMPFMDGPGRYPIRT